MVKFDELILVKKFEAYWLFGLWKLKGKFWDLSGFEDEELVTLPIVFNQSQPFLDYLIDPSPFALYFQLVEQLAPLQLNI